MPKMEFGKFGNEEVDRGTRDTFSVRDLVVSHELRLERNSRLYTYGVFKLYSGAADETSPATIFGLDSSDTPYLYIVGPIDNGISFTQLILGPTNVEAWGNVLLNDGDLIFNASDGKVQFGASAADNYLIHATDRFQLFEAGDKGYEFGKGFLEIFGNSIGGTGEAADFVTFHFISGTSSTTAYLYMLFRDDSASAYFTGGFRFYPAYLTPWTTGDAGLGTAALRFSTLYITDIDASGTLDVTGLTTLGDLDVGGDLDVTGAVTAGSYGDIDAAGNTVTADTFEIESGGPTITKHSNIAAITSAYGYIWIGPDNGGSAHIYTDRPNFYFNKQLLVNGATVWNSGNDGSGSGLDADKVDGYHASSLAKLSAANAFSGTNSFHSIWPASANTYACGTASLYWYYVQTVSIYRTNEYSLSSRKLKTRIKYGDLPGLELVMAVEPASHGWRKKSRGDTYNTKWSLIAEDVHEAVAGLGYDTDEIALTPMIENDNGKMYPGLEEGQIVQVLWKAIREQQKQLDDLKEQVALLQG